jgi:transcription antitermination factor NusG
MIHEVSRKEQLTDVQAGSSNWYALWVKSRSEFFTAQELSRKGIENYVPTITRIRQWADRRKKVDFPLFPGYVLVHVLPMAEVFLNVVKTHGSVNFVCLEPGRPTPVPPQEIESLKVLLQSGSRLDIYTALKEGTTVRVKRGALSGAIGILEKRKKEDIFIVNIEILGRSVGTRIHPDDIEQA